MLLFQSKDDTPELQDESVPYGRHDHGSSSRSAAGRGGGRSEGEDRQSAGSPGPRSMPCLNFRLAIRDLEAPPGFPHDRGQGITAELDLEDQISVCPARNRSQVTRSTRRSWRVPKDTSRVGSGLRRNYVGHPTIATFSLEEECVETRARQYQRWIEDEVHANQLPRRIAVAHEDGRPHPELGARVRSSWAEARIHLSDEQCSPNRVDVVGWAPHRNSDQESVCG